MGEETIQFASRFSIAMDRLAAIAGGGALPPVPIPEGASLATVLRDALDAVEAVYGTGTEDLCNWPEQGRRVLAQIVTMRKALGRSGVDDDMRRMARALVEIIEPRTP